MYPVPVSSRLREEMPDHDTELLVTTVTGGQLQVIDTDTDQIQPSTLKHHSALKLGTLTT